MLRIVLDTSTLVSFVLTAGDITRKLMAAWRGGEFVLLSSPQTLDELEKVLERPAIRERSRLPIGRLHTDVSRLSLPVPGQLELRFCRDPKDDKFLACAVEGHAHYLVSSDKDLLEIGQYKGVCILNPGQFLVALQLARLSSDEILARYNQDTLEAIRNTLCLEPETSARLAEAME